MGPGGDGGGLGMGAELRNGGRVVSVSGAVGGELVLCLKCLEWIYGGCDAVMAFRAS